MAETCTKFFSMKLRFHQYIVCLLRLLVMRLILNIIFSGVIVILAYKSTTAFRFTSWLLSVMNKGIKD